MEKISTNFTGNILIDFDSTFVQIEALDRLAELSLAQSSQKETILTQIENITKMGMEGQISFRESLQRRLELFTSTRSIVSELISILQNSISPSILHHQAWFQTHSAQIYIISGGFQDYILPVVQSFQIPPEHILANKFIFNLQGQIIGFESDNLLSQPRGKALAVEKLQLPGPLYIVGDGYTDYQIKETQPLATFIAYTENISRASVLAKADYQATSWSEVLHHLN